MLCKKMGMAWSGRRLSLVAAWLTLISQMPVAPAWTQEARADAFLQDQAARQHIPGLSVTVVRTGAVVFARSYGLANLENSVAATADTVYLLGSVTKTFTATAIMLLEEEGRIQLDEPFVDYIKDLSLPEHLAHITVRQLLSHTSDITDFTDIPGSVQFARMDRLPKDVVRDALALPLLFKPGGQFRYSNSNYILLGMIIERLAGKRLGAFLEQRIFHPLHMASTRMQNLRALVPHRASGYNWIDGKWLNADYVSSANLYAAGGAISSVLDLVKWDEALFSGKVVKPATLAKMMSAAALPGGEHSHYGLGLELLTDRGHAIVGHAGETFGFNATLYHYLDDRLRVIVLTNQGDAATEFLAKSLAAIFLGLSEMSYRNRNEIPDPEPRFAAILQRVIQGAAKGMVDESSFTASAGRELGPLITRAGPELLASKGALKGIALLDRAQEGQTLVLVFRAGFSNENLIWTMRVGKDGKITGLEPQPE